MYYLYRVINDTEKHMTTTSQPQTEQPTATRNDDAFTLNHPGYNPYNMEERGTLNSTIQALYMPSVEEFFTEIYY